MMSKHPATRGPRHSLLAIVVCTISALSACAVSKPAEKVPAKHDAKAAQRIISEPARLNLLTGGQATTGHRVSTIQIGSGGYICTPAGFGQRSRCRRV